MTLRTFSLVQGARRRKAVVIAILLIAQRHAVHGETELLGGEAMRTSDSFCSLLPQGSAVLNTTPGRLWIALSGLMPGMIFCACTPPMATDDGVVSLSDVTISAFHTLNVVQGQISLCMREQDRGARGRGGKAGCGARRDHE